MPLDIHKSVTFIPCLYMFLKTSWFICMVQSIVDAQNAASGTLSFQTNTNTAQFFLWLSMLLESSLDRVATTQTDLACIFTKPETSTSISLITDSFVVFFYVYDASVALKECASPTAVYVQFFFVVWALAALCIGSIETISAAKPETWTQQKLHALACCFLLVAIAVIFSSQCRMPFLQQFNLNAACLRIFLYSVLVTWRSYTASQAVCVHRSIRIYNLALFGFVFLVPLFAIGLFMLALLCVSMVGMSWLDEKDGGSSRAKSVSQSAEPRSIATVASLDEKTLAQLREMEEGHNVGRRKNAGLF